MSAQIQNDTNVMNSKLKSSDSSGNASTTSTMDNFKDPGQQNSADRPNEYMNNVDNPNVSSDSQHYPPQNMNPDGYHKMVGDPNMQNHMNYGRPYGNSMNHDRQHGDYSQQNSQYYGQYGMQQMRGNYPQNPRMAGSMPGMGHPGSNMNMGQGPYGNQNRMNVMSGHGMQQGPTPTLNHLLTNTSSGQRYPGNYGDYQKAPNDPSHAYGNQMWGGQQNPMNAPHGQQPGNHVYRNQGGGMYDSQGRHMPGMNNYPPQGGPGGGPGGYGDYGMGGPRGYPGQQHPRGPGGMSMPPGNQPPYNQQQVPQQYGGGGYNQYNMAGGMPHQQQGGPQQQQQPGGSAGGLTPPPPAGPTSNATTPTPGTPAQHNTSTASIQDSPSSRPSSNATIIDENSSPETETSSPAAAVIPSSHNISSVTSIAPSSSSSTTTSSSPVVTSGSVSNSSDSGTTAASVVQGSTSSDINTATTTCTTLASSSSANTLSSASSANSIPHPAPSPAGSTGSRSNTPASIHTPQGSSQCGSPAPGQNVPNHIDSGGGPSNRIQSPMATQGFNHHMMPPPGGVPSSGPPGYGGGKMGPGSAGMHHMGHPGQQHMGGYNPQGPHGHYQNQPGGTMGRPGGPVQWNPQQNAYGMSGHHPNGPGMMPGMHMNRHMSNNYGNYNHMNNHMGGPPGPNAGPGGGGSGSSTPQDNLPPNQTLPPNMGHGNNAGNMNSMSSPSSSASVQTPQPSQNTSKGAQAAAQAAVEAAAKFAGSNKDHQGKQPSASTPPNMGPMNQRPGMPAPYNQQYPGGPHGVPHGGPHSGPHGGPHAPGNMNHQMNYGGMINQQHPQHPGHLGMSNQGGGVGDHTMGGGGMGQWHNNQMGGPGGPHGMQGPHQPGGMQGPPHPGVHGIPGAPNNMPPAGMPQPGAMGGAGPQPDGMNRAPSVDSNAEQKPLGMSTPNSIGDTSMSSSGPPVNSTPTSVAGPGNAGPMGMGSGPPGGGPSSNDPSLQAQLHNDNSQSSQISQQSNSQDSVLSGGVGGVPPQSNTPSLTNDDSSSVSSVPTGAATAPTTAGPTAPMGAAGGMLPREVRITKHENLSHPPTPASIVPSPSASMSSVHDELESINSPNWTGTPAQKPVGNEGVLKMYEMGDEPDRRMFLDQLFSFMDERGAPITAMPCISKQPIDLFKLFVVVRDKGGILEVTKSKKWREVCAALNLGASGSAGFTLRKNYIKYLLSYECKFLKGGIDPGPIIAKLESMSQKKESKKGSKSTQNSTNDTFRPQPPAGQNFDGYSSHNQFGQPQGPGAPQGHMGQNDMSGGGMPGPHNMMPNNHGGMMPNSNMPPYDNNMMQANNGMPPHNTNSGMPPHNASSMPPNTTVMPPNPGMMSGMMNNASMSNNSTNNMISTAGSNMPHNMNSQMNPNVPGMPPGMAPNRSMPSMNNIGGSGDSISVTDPFSDEANSQFQQRGAQNVPPYGGGYMNNYGMNRPGMPAPQYINQNGGNQVSTANGGMGATTTVTSASAALDGAKGDATTAKMPNDVSGEGEKADEKSASVASDSKAAPTVSSVSTTSTTTTATTASTTATATSSSSDTTTIPVVSSSVATSINNTNTSSSSTVNCSPSPSPSVAKTEQSLPAVPQRYSSPLQTLSPLPNSRSHTPQDPSSQQFQQPPAPSQSPHMPPQQQGPHGGAPPPNQGPHMGGLPQGYKGTQYPSQQQMSAGGYPGARPPYGNQMAGGAAGGPTDQYNAGAPQGMYGGAKPPGVPDMYQQQKRFNDYNMPPNAGRDQQPQGPPGQWGTGPPGMAPPHPQQAQRYTAPSPTSMGMSQSHMPPLYSRVNTPSHRMSPQRMPEKGVVTPPTPASAQPFASPSKMPKGSAGMMSPYHMKKDFSFPPDSVEAAQPVTIKRRKVTAKDIGQVDPWRLMMSLKSGLLAESTWALDMLTVLLYDDATLMYFNLQSLPGLLEVLLEHFRHCLIAIFDMFHELEITTKRCGRFQPSNNSVDGTNGRTSPDLSEPPTLEHQSSLPKGSYERINGITLITPEHIKEENNYTYHTRHGKRVKIEMDSSMVNTVAERKDWDQYEGFETGMHLWMVGQGCVTDHIITQFESEDTRTTLYERFYGKKNSQIKMKLTQGNSKVLNDSAASSHAEEKDAADDLAASPRANCSGSEAMDCSDVKVEPSCDDAYGGNSKSKCDGASDGCDSKPASSGNSPVNSSDKPSNSSCDTKDETCDGANVDNKDTVKPVDCKSESSENSESKENKGENPSEHVIKYYPVRAEDAVLKHDMEIVESLKREYDEMQGEAEALCQDKYPLDLCTSTEDELSQRCVCISNILRNLSFVPGNDVEMCKHRSLVMILGRLLLLHHEHPKSTDKNRNYDRDTDIEQADDTPDVVGKHEWWWDTLECVRENTLVALSNMAGYLNLQLFPEEVSLPILDGLLHWVVCPSSYALDPMPSMSSRSDLTPQRLALETMCKLTVNKPNIDLLLVTPPYSRVLQLVSCLVRLLSDKKEQVLREFSIVLLSSMVEASTEAARAVALHQPCISLLIDFIETAEQFAAAQMNMQQMPMHDHAEQLGTSLDMLRRAASALAHMSAVPLNRTMFVQHQARLLQLVMSHILDQSVASHLADVLYRCSQS